MGNSEKEQKIIDFSILQRLFSFTAPYRFKLILSLILSVLLAGMAPIRPLLIQITINKGIASNSTAFFLNGPGGFLIEITLFQIFFLLIESLFRFYFTFTTASLGQSVVKDLRESTFKKILSFRLKQFDTTPIGTLTTRTINDLESVNDIFSDGLIPIIADLLSIISVLFYMFYTDWQVTLVCLLPFPLLIVSAYIFKESVNKSFLKVRNAVAELNAFVQEHISGMAIVQAFAAEREEKEKFEKINHEHRKANIRAIFAYSVFFPVVELVSAISIGLLVWWAARKSGLDPNMSHESAGVITAFILCLNLLFRPLRVIADKFNVLQMGMIAGARVFKILDNADVEQTMTDENIHVTPELKNLKGEIRFNHVWFAYNEEQYVLKDINFHLPAGKTMAIVGSTGSGKSTLAGLINKLYPVEKGSIEIDGADINLIDTSALRSHIAVVLQDVFLFGGSVKDNITLRNKNISREQLTEAAGMIGLDDFIRRLPGNYDFNVMERGVTLSLGQRQLLSFVRAILYNPSILILDEATSSIDSESEQLIQQAIEKMVKGRTSIIIAHRLSTVRKADMILVMNKGEVVESGTHEELLAVKGYYHDLYSNLSSQFKK